MPKIPDQFSLGGLPNADSQRPIAKYDTSTIGEGAAALGGNISGIGRQGGLGRDLYDVAERAQQATAVNANAAFLSGNIDLISSLQHDNDYTTLADRYQKQAATLRDQQAESIPNPALRQRFVDQANVHISEGLSHITQQAFRAQGDASIDFANQQGDKFIAQAPSVPTNGTRTAIIQQQAQLYDSLADRGIITRVQAQAAKQGWIQRYVGSSLNALPPEQRLQLFQKYDEAVKPQPGQEPANPNVQALNTAASNLGIAPRDLAAAISYETGGKFSPSVRGGKDNNYLGLIQFGPEEQGQYGVTANQSFPDQMQSVEQYLRDRGVKPGMNLSQIYSIINAGSLNADGTPRLNASDGNGTVSDHVTRIQAQHYASADKFLGYTKSGTLLDFLPPDQIDQLRHRAQVDLHAQEIDQRQQQQQQAAEAKKASDDRELQVFQDIHSEKPQLSTQQILDDPALSKEAKERMFNLKSQVTGGDHVEKTYGRGFYAAYQAVHAPDGDPSRITDPAQLYRRVGPNGDLTVAGVDKLVAEIQGRKTPEGVAESEMKKAFLDYAKKQMTYTNVELNLKDPNGEERYLQFLADALPAYDRGRAAGKTPAQLLTHDSPDYIGKSIDILKRSRAQELADYVVDHKAGQSAPFDLASVKTLADAAAAYKAGKITRDQARALATAHPEWGVTMTPAAAVPQVPMSQ